MGYLKNYIAKSDNSNEEELNSLMENDIRIQIGKPEEETIVKQFIKLVIQDYRGFKYFANYHPTFITFGNGRFKHRETGNQFQVESDNTLTFI